MKLIGQALLDGALVVLPLGAVALLVLGIIHRLQAMADPLSSTYVHPAIAAALMLLLLCVLVGVLVRSATGRQARRLLEAGLLERIPGYRLARAFAAEGPLMGQGRALRPALAHIEEGLCPALVMDEFADGRLMVFVPGSPAPMSGAIYIFTPDKVQLLDVPLMPFLRGIASWGLGLREMIEAEAARRA
ncbi:hypothetical protein KTR66_01555 [Roseococcus sp. SDR]|uniref:hypothetical protein n=1 Tax=Roseococcus sp. SDR TaxID=2835532 RepID=UPI001BD0F6F0|nr:hypothetical protein [Roseococcus sp. SDR]MBS7788658.1 hypothetical protein [Roseococcus sp. SDR]MBV1843972.1 hypothetical protein [Roseococcus sp. SDR]